MGLGPDRGEAKLAAKITQVTGPATIVIAKKQQVLILEDNELSRMNVGDISKITAIFRHSRKEINCP